MTATDTPPASPLPLPTLLRRAGAEAPELAEGLVGTLALSVVATAAQVVVPIALQWILDNQVVGVDEIDLGRVALFCGAAVVALVVAVVAGRAGIVRLVEATARGLATLRVRVFRHIHDLSVLHVQAERRGVLVSRVTADVEAVTRFLEWGGIGMLVGFTQVVLTLVVMLVYEWRLALLSLVSALLYAGLLVLFQRVLQRGYDRVRVAVGESLAAVGETLSGLVTIRAYGAEQRSRERVATALDEQFRQEFRVGALGALMFSSAELFAASVTAGIVAAGIALADTGLTAGQLVAFLFLVTLFIDPVQLLVELLNEAQTAASGLRRVVEVLDTPVDVADPGDDGRSIPTGAIGVRFDGVTLSLIHI